MSNVYPHSGKWLYPNVEIDSEEITPVVTKKIINQEIETDNGPVTIEAKGLEVITVDTTKKTPIKEGFIKKVKKAFSNKK